MEPKYFIAIYTNVVKDYCDEKFIKRVHELSKGNPVHIVDNTIGEEYFNKLHDLCKDYENIRVHHVNVPEEPARTQFLRNVEQSVNYLRNIFLQSGIPNFFIIESDVLSPVDVLDQFDKTIEQVAPLAPKWGILGGLYYDGFHDYKATGINKTHHVLSGCSVYRRELVEKYPFRWSTDNLGAFPDAWICYDSGNEFALYNNHDIKCEHLTAPNGTRYSHK